MKNIKNITIASFFLAGVSQAATTIYFQDFSGTNPVTDDTVTAATTGQIITGGDIAAQSTNGDYSIEITNNADSFVFNSTASVPFQSPNNDMSVSPDPGVGFSGINTSYVFTSGTITTGGGLSGAVAITASGFNVGGEFLSINSVLVDEDLITGEVTLTVDYNAFGDFQSGGTESVGITTNFGGDFDADGSELVTTALQNTAVEGQFSFTLVNAVPEPSSTALLGLGGLALLARRRR